MQIFKANDLTNDEVLSGMKTCLSHERQALTRFLLLLSECDQRRLHLHEGEGDLFRYLVHRLGLCESSACKRLAVARLIRRFPLAASLLSEERTHLTGLYLVARHIGSENAEELLELIAGKSRREIELALAARFPAPDKREILRAQPQTSAAGGQPATIQPPAPAPTPPECPPAPPAADPTMRAPQQRCEPLSASAFRLAVTIDAKTQATLARLRELSPKKQLADILAEALTLLAAKVDPVRREERRRGKVQAGVSPEKLATRNPKSLATRDRVHCTAHGQCTFLGNNGHRCSERVFLEIHHEKPRSEGGSDEPENLRLLCRSHHDLVTRQTFGPTFVDARISARRLAASAPSAAR